MAREIGDIGWFTLEEALAKIRPESVEKRELVLKVGRILRNFCPVEI
jgi:NADH pyrophosphatase NudC (nudix superfamily)